MLGGVHSSTVLKIEEQGASVGSALRKASLGMSKDSSMAEIACGTAESAGQTGAGQRWRA